jgi:hypothetical protein
MNKNSFKIETPSNVFVPIELLSDGKQVTLFGKSHIRLT